MILHDLVVDAHELSTGTGWAVEPQGACRGDLCVPLPDDVRTGDDRIDVRRFAECLGMPLAHDARAGVWALGPATAVTGRALSTAVAPELELPDLDGRAFRLSSLRGQKVLLVSWASW